MDKSLIEGLYKQAEEIAKDTAAQLMKFSKQTAEVLYGRLPVNINPGQFKDDEESQAKNIAEQYQQYQEVSIAKAEFAPMDKLREADEMMNIITEGNAKIKKLYQEGLAAWADLNANQ